jgi:hypothetical protein
MKKFGFAVIAASALGTGLLGLAGPAQAAVPVAAAPEVSATVVSTGVDHLGWLDQIQPKVNVPSVDNTVRHSGR